MIGYVPQEVRLHADQSVRDTVRFFARLRRVAATRGGLATVLNEIADASRVAIEIDEVGTPIREEVKAFCEILGLDPLYLANEGKIVVIAPPAR